MPILAKLVGSILNLWPTWYPEPPSNTLTSLIVPLLTVILHVAPDPVEDVNSIFSYVKVVASEGVRPIPTSSIFISFAEPLILSLVIEPPSPTIVPLKSGLFAWVIPIPGSISPKILEWISVDIPIWICLEAIISGLSLNLFIWLLSSERIGL